MNQKQQTIDPTTLTDIELAKHINAAQTALATIKEQAMARLLDIGKSLSALQAELAKRDKCANDATPTE